MKHYIVHRLMGLERRQKFIISVALVLCIASLALTLFLRYRYHQEKSNREATAFIRAKQEASIVASRISQELANLTALATSIANDLTNGDLEHKMLTDSLRRELEANPAIFGLGAAYQPEAYKVGLTLYAPYYIKNEKGNFKRIQVEDFYDYTQPPRDDPNTPNTTWYHDPIRKGAMWHELYFSTVADTFLVEYIAPFYRVAPDTLKKVPIGVIYANHSVETFTQFVDSLDLGKEGYSYILSRQGEYIVHPDTGFLGTTILEKAEELRDNKLRADGERVLQGESFSREGIDPTTGRRAWMFYERIPLTNLSLEVVLDKSAWAAAPNITIRSLTWIALALIACLCFLSVLIFRADRGTTQSLWRVIISVMVLFTSGIGFIWYLVITNSPRESHEIVLTNKTSLNEYLNSIDLSFQDRALTSALRVPTGIFVQSIKITDINEAAVSGYIWQKYTADTPDEIVKEFIFPQVIDEEAGNIEEVYRFQEGDIETIGWFFRATLRQSFNVSKYPLDRAVARIQIWPKSLNQNVILIPDLDAYKFMDPTQKPGLAHNLLLEGRDITRSFFSFQFAPYNANFGSDHAIRKNDTPDLYFNINVRRRILSPVIAHAVTILVVTALMFGILVIDAESAFNVLSYAAALFFVVAIAHVGLRGELEADSVVYFEYFYILIYIVILLVSVNSILFYLPIHIPFIEYRKNLIPKLLYWPIVSGILLAITTVTFYPPLFSEEAIKAIRKQPEILPEESFARHGTGTGVEFTAEVESDVEPAESIADKRITLYSPTFFITLDPALWEDFNSFTQINNLFVGLTQIDFKTGEALPYLATDWSVSADGLTWTFHLRDDIAWVHYAHQTGKVTQVTDFNGKPRFVNAHDVVYSIRRALNPDTPSNLANLLYVIKHAEEVNTGQDARGNPTQLTLADIGVEAVDNHTMTFTLEHPAAYFPTILGNPIAYPVPEWAINEWGDKWIEPGWINTNGPYMLAKWVHDKHARLVKNPFWIEAGQVQIEVVEQPIIEDQQTALTMYEENKLDTVYLPLADMDRIQADPGLSKDLVSFSTLSTDCLNFVHTKPPFNDVRVRRAFSAAVDRKAIIYAEVGDIPATTFAPPGVFGAPVPGTLGQGFDPDVARTSLQEFLDEKGLTIAEFNTSYNIVLVLTGYYSGSESYAKMANTIQKMWQDILGVKVRVEVREYEYAYDKSSPVENVPHIYFDGWFADYPDEHNWVYAVFNSEAGLNFVRRNCADPNCEKIADPTEFDTLTAAAAQATDPAKRRELYARAEHILAAEEVAYIPLFHPGQPVLAKPWLTRNYPPDYTLDFYNWTIDVEAQKAARRYTD